MTFVKKYAWIALLIVVAAFLVFKSSDTHSTLEEEPEFIPSSNKAEAETAVENTNEESKSSIFVDVKGEVKSPGVYQVKAGQRVDDVLAMAGGMTHDADPASVNLAQKLQDEMVILVSSSQQEAGTGELSSQMDKLRINQATAEEIESLQGIGPSKAAAIVQYREEEGPFKSKEDLLNVGGIGEKTLEAISENIQVP
ncbi:ComEA family DNA-binding protein [Halobacillus rhizosphaerae]|uniref:helix-hairpin-helix domain-containing protein n=1 Tax=Halobacillus rhizosphaerae TaxID=3064889 RepID=UPI00398AAAE9